MLSSGVEALDLDHESFQPLLAGFRRNWAHDMEIHRSRSLWGFGEQQSQEQMVVATVRLSWGSRFDGRFEIHLCNDINLDVGDIYHMTVWSHHTCEENVSG